MKKCWLTTCALIIFQSFLFTDASLDSEQLLAKNTTARNQSYISKSRKKISNPYLVNPDYLGFKEGLFFQTNIGVGFLYFSGVNGSTGATYNNTFTNVDQAALVGRSLYRNHLRYNRTPLFEYLLGYQWAPGIKGAFSYQHQGGISVQSAMESGRNNLVASSLFPPHPYSQLRTNLSLDAFMAQFILEYPRALICKKIAIAPYLGIGVGAGWQSWTNIELEQTAFLANVYGNFILPLRNKYIANAVWMANLGIHFRSATPDQEFSVVVGCKYNNWGQAYNIGKVGQQNAPKRGLVSPFGIDTLYSFAPYLGVQWSLSNDCSIQAPHNINGNNVNQWTPFIAHSYNFAKQPTIFTQFSAGPGFLYFSGQKGNILAYYADPGTTSAGLTADQAAIQGFSLFDGHIRYNRTPLFEYLLGYQWNAWLKLAFSYQHQGGISVQSAMEKGSGTNFSVSNTFDAYSQFRSDLSLDAFMAKVYFEFPHALICKGIATSPYLAIGIGPSWQSWTDVELEQTNLNISDLAYTNNLLPLRNKYIANAAFMVDAGLHFQSAYPYSHFSILAGCKYNQWGQARNIGKVSQQNEPKRGLVFPFSIKTIYSFAPYLGVQWNFSNNYSYKTPYAINGKQVNRYKPFLAGTRNLQMKKSIFTQFNAGIGFLYFSGVNGSTFVAYETPAKTSSGNTIWGGNSIKGKLRYNRTPLYEYLLGYQWNAWLKLALSYQYQGGISVQSAMEAGLGTNPSNSINAYSQLRTNLSLDALMAKIYFELPCAFICKGVATSFYISPAVGSSWQSWTNIVLEQTTTDAPNYNNYPLPLRSKYIANAAWMLDLGFHLKSAYPNNNFSVFLGCKYNQWGQTRNIGKISQQNEPKRGLVNPFRIQIVYSFAPYLGVQWNF